MQRHSLSSAAFLIFVLAAAPTLAAPPEAAAAPTTSTPMTSTPAPTSPPTAQVGFGGPVVPGVCLLSRETVFAQSAVGQAAAARLKQLSLKAQAGLDAERRTLESEAKALQTQQATLPPDQIQHRQQQLSARAQGLQVKAAQASRELEATRAKVMGRIEEEVQPVAVTVYQAKGCGLLLSRDAVLGGNLTNDLTSAVVQGLDAKITTITFEREHLPLVATPAGR